jgi:hypothetical protein
MDDMKKLTLLTLATLAATGFLPMTAAFADGPSDEASFVARINSLRAGKGLPGLKVDAGLTSKARGWAQTMADRNLIWHSVLSDGNTADWQRLGENVGQGGSVAGLDLAFVNSPLHYKNLVDPTFSSIGLGVVRSADGVVFVAEEFMELRTGAVDPAAPATAPIAAPRPHALAPVATRTPVAVKTPVAVEGSVVAKAPLVMRIPRFAPLGRWVAGL